MIGSGHRALTCPASSAAAESRLLYEFWLYSCRFLSAASASAPPPNRVERKLAIGRGLFRCFQKAICRDAVAPSMRYFRWYPQPKRLSVGLWPGGSMPVSEAARDFCAGPPSCDFPHREAREQALLSCTQTTRQASARREAVG